jgi:hypothetical protein
MPGLRPALKGSQFVKRRLGRIASRFLPLALVAICGCPTGPGVGETARLLFSNLNAALLSVSGTSVTDVYAVGADPGDGDGPYVLHYDGQIWRRLMTGTTGDLWWISVAPLDGHFFMAGADGQVLRFDPATASFEPLQTPGGSGETVFGVWGTDQTHVWAVGGNLDSPDDSGFLWRFDGVAWTPQDLTCIAPDGLPILYKVWGRTSNDVYAVGRLGTVLHFDGAAWSFIPTDTTSTIFTISGNDELAIAVGGFVNAVIVEQDGDSFVDRAPAGLPQMSGIFVSPDGSAVAVGTEASVARRGAGGWALDAAEFDTFRDFHAAWMDPQGGVWAVGGNLSGALNDGILAYIGTADVSTAVAP